jgi:hypothetical protein
METSSRFIPLVDDLTHILIEAGKKQITLILMQPYSGMVWTGVGSAYGGRVPQSATELKPKSFIRRRAVTNPFGFEKTNARNGSTGDSVAMVVDILTPSFLHQLFRMARRALGRRSSGNGEVQGKEHRRADGY